MKSRKWSNGRDAVIREDVKQTAIVLRKMGLFKMTVSLLKATPNLKRNSETSSCALVNRLSIQQPHIVRNKFKAITVRWKSPRKPSLIKVQKRKIIKMRFLDFMLSSSQLELKNWSQMLQKTGFIKSKEELLASLNTKRQLALMETRNQTFERLNLWSSSIDSKKVEKKAKTVYYQKYFSTNADITIDKKLT